MYWLIKHFVREAIVISNRVERGLKTSLESHSKSTPQTRTRRVFTQMDEVSA